MAQKGKPAPHVSSYRTRWHKFYNPKLFILLNSPREPYFRTETVAGVEIKPVLGGVKPISQVGGEYVPGLATVPLRQAPVIILKGRREQARRMRQMGRGAS